MRGFGSRFSRYLRESPLCCLSLERTGIGSRSRHVQAACRGLGVQSAVHRLFKLLVYEPGGKFIQHRDTEKEKGMFGTLVVQLPSDFHGGELVVTHQGKELVFSGNSKSLTWPPFYADCQHDVTPVMCVFFVPVKASA